MPPRRIDTHTHVVPPAYAEWLPTQPLYRGPVLDWTSGAALDAYERLGIETGILSVSPPGLPMDRDLVREINTFCAEVVRDAPRRFGFFASLPLPSLDASIEEARHSLDALGADGVVVSTHTGDVYLGAPEWDPLLEYLDERRAVLFVHPVPLPGSPVPGISPGIVDFLADTTRAAVNMTKHRCLTRFARLRVLLSHGGGYVPYVANRIGAGLSLESSEAEVLGELRRFYFDAALTGGPFGLPSLIAFADPEHLTFGSDWPYEPKPGMAGEFTARLDQFDMPEHRRLAIDRKNAERLFPRLAD